MDLFTDEYFMKEALKEAQKALAKDETPETVNVPPVLMLVLIVEEAFAAMALINKPKHRTKT